MSTNPHRGRIVVAIVAAIVVAIIGAGLAGCSSHVKTGAGADQPTTSTVSVPPRQDHYSLYTHCGIEWAEINRRWWKATRPLSDGNGNPPAGWGNPFQSGELTFVDAATARFTSSAGAVTFHRTERTRPPFSCA